MRISDGSSDVCSSDLVARDDRAEAQFGDGGSLGGDRAVRGLEYDREQLVLYFDSAGRNRVDRKRGDRGAAVDQQPSRYAVDRSARTEMAVGRHPDAHLIAPHTLTLEQRRYGKGWC